MTNNSRIDMWYGDTFEPKKYRADAYFYGNIAEYRGNIYNNDGKIIGDYSANNSLWIEENFIIEWAGRSKVSE